MNTSQLMNQIKEDPTIIDQLIYPGKPLAQYDVDKLAIDVLPCGFYSLDRNFIFKRGRGELIFIGARPSQGKSALLIQIATGIAEYGRTHIITLEDGHESIATRQTASFLNISMGDIQRGSIDRKRLLYAQDQLSRLNIIVDDRGALNVYQICDAIRMQNKKQKLSAAFIDYIQIIKSDRKVSRNEDLGVISGELKSLAKELCIPIIVASQLSRGSEYLDKSGKSRPPQLSDLRDSGSLEQDADVVLLIHRVNKDADVIIAKNKNGPTCSIKMKYQGDQCRFIDTGGELD